MREQEQEQDLIPVELTADEYLDVQACLQYVIRRLERKQPTAPVLENLDRLRAVREILTGACWEHRSRIDSLLTPSMKCA